MPAPTLLNPLLKRIQSVPEGQRLSSARRLAEEFEVHRATMNQAIDYLIGTGVVRREGYKLFRASETSDTGFAVHVVGPEGPHHDPVRMVVESFGGSAVCHTLSESGPRRGSLLEVRHSGAEGLLVWHAQDLDVIAECERTGMATVVCAARWPGHNFVTDDLSKKSGLALDHLVALGHREIALMIQLPRRPDREAANALSASYRDSCRSRGLDSCADRIEEVTTEADLANAWNRLFRRIECPPTAMLCSENALANLLVRQALESGLSVPRDLSLVSLVERSDALHCDPPLTTVDVSFAAMGRIAAFVLCEEIQRRRANPMVQSRQAIVCEPTIHLRGSTAGISQTITRFSQASRRSRWSDDAEVRRQEADRVNRGSFRGLDRAATFHPLDLASQVNRGFAPRSSWLGDLPLRHFKPGDHVVHGIPFRVAEGAEQRHSAIVLRSRKVRSSRSTALPELVELPVGRVARSVFLLHAAGWTRRHEAFARYEFCFEDGSELRLPVISFSRGPEEARKIRAWRAESTIQDWHPSYVPLRTSGVLPYLVTQNGDPLIYERYLYACRWINPTPEKPIRCIRIRSLMPEIRATLAVLGITLETVR